MDSGQLAKAKLTLIKAPHKLASTDIDDKGPAGLPIGATEQHGPHLPLSTDSVVATAVAEATVAEVEANCRGAQWGCIDCKKVLHANMVAELNPIRERASALMASPSRCRW